MLTPVFVVLVRDSLEFAPVNVVEIYIVVEEDVTANLKMFISFAPSIVNLPAVDVVKLVARFVVFVQEKSVIVVVL